MEWQPIETAPKDGTRIKLLIPYDREKFSEAECTDEGRWEALSAGDQLDQEWARQAGGYFRFDGDDGPFDIQPTHWKPLP